MNKFQVYLASPLFTIGEQFWNEIVVQELRSAGYEVFNPQSDNTANDKDNKDAIVNAKAIFDQDTLEVLNSNIIVANLDGLSIDAGVANELGIFWAMKKVVDDSFFKGIVGYRSDIRKNGENDQRFYFNQYVVGGIEDVGKIVDLNPPESKVDIEGYRQEARKIVKAVNDLVENQIESNKKEISIDKPDSETTRNEEVIYKVIRKELVGYTQADAFDKDFSEEEAIKKNVISLIDYFDNKELAEKVKGHLENLYYDFDWCDSCMWFNEKFYGNEKNFERDKEEGKMNCGKIEITKKIDDDLFEYKCTSQDSSMAAPMVSFSVEECFISKIDLNKLNVIKYDDYVNETFSLKNYYENNKSKYTDHPYILTEKDLQEYKAHETY